MAKVTNNSGYSYTTNYTKNLKIFEKNIDKNNNIVALIKLIENNISVPVAAISKIDRGLVLLHF